MDEGYPVPGGAYDDGYSEMNEFPRGPPGPSRGQPMMRGRPPLRARGRARGRGFPFQGPGGYDPLRDLINDPDALRDPLRDLVNNPLLDPLRDVLRAPPRGPMQRGPMRGGPMRGGPMPGRGMMHGGRPPIPPEPPMDEAKQAELLRLER
jgi:hypothetical protein